MSATFLIKSRHGTTYFFRRRVPTSLLSVLKKGQLVTSLRTSDIKEAKIRARKLAVHTDELFKYLMNQMAKKKITPENKLINFEYVLQLELGDDKTPKRIHIETNQSDPNDQLAAQRALETIMGGKQSLNTPSSEINLTLEKAIEQFFIAKHDLATATKQTYKTHFEELVKFFGPNCQCLDISQSKLVGYADSINSNTKRSVKTSNQYIKSAAMLLGWARIRNDKPPITSATLTRKIKSAPSEARDHFSDDDLKIFFKHFHKFKNKNPEKFWAAIVPLFTGLRAEEFCQLHIPTDLLNTNPENVNNGIWYISINKDPDPDGQIRKSLKTNTSKRNVAIHSFLVKNGFIKYLQDQVESGFTRPFEGHWKTNIPKNSSVPKWSCNVGKWGGREVNQIRSMLHDKGRRITFFHSARHTLITLLANKDVNPEKRSAITGQEYETGVNATIYTKIKFDPATSSNVLEENLQSFIDLFNKSTSI